MCQILNGRTPFELLYERPPSLEHLQIFGCLCYTHNIDHRGDKFESRSRKCLFIGYPYGKKGWRIYDLEKEVFFVSRYVVFCENTFPYSENKTSSSPDHCNSR